MTIQANPGINKKVTLTKETEKKRDQINVSNHFPSVTVPFTSVVSTL